MASRVAAGPRSIAVVALACVWTAATDARAFEAVVRAETLSQSLQIRGPAGAPVLSLRRLTSSLTLSGVELPEDPRGATISLRARLRIDADFGGACQPNDGRCLDEQNPGRSSDFEPLFVRRSLDLPFAFLDVQGLLRHRVDLRLGRQFVVDPLGFFLFDGARARVHLGSAASVEVYGGLETRSGFPLSSGRYERDGLLRADRTAWDPLLAPRVQDRVSAGVLGVVLESSDTEPLYARLTWRRVWTADGIAEEKLGSAVEVAASRRVRVFTDAVYSLPQRSLTTLSAGVEWNSPRHHVLGVELARYRPTFDLTSIWASFWSDPTDDLRAHAEIPLSPRWNLVGSLLGRRYALSEGGPSSGGELLPDLYAGGGGLGLVARRGRWDGSLRGSVEAGALGGRGGVDLSARAWVLPNRVRVDVGVSLWSVTDALRPDRDVTSLAVNSGATLRLGSVALVHLNIEDDINRIVGQRLRVVGILDFRSPL